MPGYVYDFAHGDRDMRALLGGKGANLAEMTSIGLPVPDGFTITTEACLAFLRAGGTWPEGLREQVDGALAELEERTGKRLGGGDDPLLVSVRSGAPISMPGMMDTILNLGLNDQSVEKLAAAAGDERFAFDSYRRLIQMFGDVVAGVPASLFEDVLTRAKLARRASSDVDLDAAALRELVGQFKGVFRSSAGEDFPQDPRQQLDRAVEAVFRSWNTPRAIAYRRREQLSDDLGTAVNVQQMVFGNFGPDSGTGVAFSRNPSTGVAEPYGEFLANAQGEDVVAGVRTAGPLTDLPRPQPGGIRATGRGDGDPGAPLRRHAGHGVHDRARPPLHAADAQRQARPAGRAWDRGGHGLGGRRRPRAGAAPDRRQPARARAAADGWRPRRPPAAGHRPSRLRRRRGRHRRLRRRHRPETCRRRRVGDPRPRRNVGRGRRRDGPGGRRRHLPRRHDVSRGGRRPRLGHTLCGRRGGARHRRRGARVPGR